MAKDLQDLEGKTDANLVIPNALRSDSGVYRVIVSNESGTSFSRDAFVFVSTTPQQRWKEENFEDPFSEDAQNESDPDEDGLTNLVEFGYGSDPLSGTQKNLPAISLTKVESDTFIQIRVFQNPSASDVSLKPELTDDLRSPDWLAIESMDTVIIEKEVDYIDYKIPISGPRFFRVRAAME